MKKYWLWILIPFLFGCKSVYSREMVGTSSYPITELVPGGFYQVQTDESLPSIEIEAGKENNILALVSKETKDGKESIERYDLVFKEYQKNIFANATDKPAMYLWFKAVPFSKENRSCLRLLRPKAEVFDQFVSENKLPGKKEGGESAYDIILDKLEEKDYQFIVSQESSSIYEETSPIEFCKLSGQ